MTEKKVNIYSTMPLFINNTILRGNAYGVKMSLSAIRNCIVSRAVVEEILDDNSIVRLSLANYDKDNTIKTNTTPNVKPETPIVEYFKQDVQKEIEHAEAAKKEPEVKQEEKVEDVKVEEPTVEQPVAELVAEVKPEPEIKEEEVKPEAPAVEQEVKVEEKVEEAKPQFISEIIKQAEEVKPEPETKEEEVKATEQQNEKHDMDQELLDAMKAEQQQFHAAKKKKKH